MQDMLNKYFAVGIFKNIFENSKINMLKPLKYLF